MSKNLVIVESPAKAKTIEKFLGKDYSVKSCFGHIRDLEENSLSIDIENGFKPKYVVPDDKKKLVTDLKKETSSAETVWLATDEDREGEAISWHIVQTLKIPEDKIRRIVFHEITKPAILGAIENPRGIDHKLVDAQQARRVLDRLVGYELSPVLWKKVKPALSAGRVQSVAVRLIAERENEIRNFKTEGYFRVTGIFLPEQGKKDPSVQAELDTRFRTREEALSFLEKCIGSGFSILKIETKPSKKSPPPPFTTSTLQQEASRKLGFSVSKTMMVAQQLYEAGKITYMRTDSVNLSNLAINLAKRVIRENFGEEYVHSRQYVTRSKSAQEAHEAIRPTYPETRSVEGDPSQVKLYDLIWKRTIASQMKDAMMEKTNVDISVSGAKEIFIARGEVIKFDGFLKVYNESSDEDEADRGGGILPPLKEGQPIFREEISAIQRFTQSNPRYTEASLVRKLEELGIGRPSTYAPTISTIQKREYVIREDRPGTEREFIVLSLKDDHIKSSVKSEKTGYEKAKLFPTDIGMVVNNFLVENFNTVLDYNFTANVEKEFDEIARGEKIWNKMIADFYSGFRTRVSETLETSKKQSGERFLGIDPASGKKVYAKIGRFGPVVQIGDTDDDVKPRFAGMKKQQSIETITLEEALELFSLPRIAGTFENGDMMVAIGRFGPFIKHKDQFYSLGKNDDPYTISQDQAIAVIEMRRTLALNKVAKEFPSDPSLKVLRGRFNSIYISKDKKNYPLPKNTRLETLTLEDCMKIIRETGDGKTARPTGKRKMKK